MEEFNETKSRFFKKLNEIDKPLADRRGENGRRFKLLKSRMRMEALLLTLQKRKGL